jgi:uncharacterized protein YkwD
VNGSRHEKSGQSGLRASLVAVLLGAAVAGSATLASHLTTSDPANLDAAPNQPPALMVTADHLGPTPEGEAVKGAVPTTTTTTTTVPVTTTTSAAPPPPITTTTTKPPAHWPGGGAPGRPGQAGNQTAELIAYLNAIRQQTGCRALTEDSRLDHSAQQHTQAMAANSQDGSASSRERAAGYPKPGGESVASGETSAGQVIEQWARSHSDEQNIVNCAYVSVGVGLDTSGWYWTADYGQ